MSKRKRPKRANKRPYERHYTTLFRLYLPKVKTSIAVTVETHRGATPRVPYTPKGETPTEPRREERAFLMTRWWVNESGKTKHLGFFKCICGNRCTKEDAYRAYESRVLCSKACYIEYWGVFQDWWNMEKEARARVEVNLILMSHDLVSKDDPEALDIRKFLLLE